MTFRITIADVRSSGDSKGGSVSDRAVVITLPSVNAWNSGRSGLLNSGRK